MASTKTLEIPDLSRLLAPRGIAVVGASSDPSRIGGQPIRALTEFGYQGSVYPVNPKYDEIKGLPCYPDLVSVPQPCDIALIAVPAPHVIKAIDDCGQAGIPFAIILSAGFREIGGKGEQLQRDLEAAIARSGVRVIGPNCQGIMSLPHAVYCGFGAPFQYPHQTGSTAIVTQSGGFGYAVMGLAESAGIGFNYVISTGNETDLDTLDLLAYLLERDDVEVVASYMEGVTDGRRLVAIGQRALELAKPLVVWKVGNSDTGQRAAASHTANLTAGYALYQTAFKQGGFVEVRDVDDLVDVTRAFHLRRLPQGKNVAVISISGGAGVMLADRCEELGLSLPQLSDATLQALREFMPEFSSLLNPIDVTAQVFNDLDMFNRAVSLVLNDPAIDQAIICNASVQGAFAEKLARELIDIAAKTDKPLHVAWSAPPTRAAAAMTLLADSRIPCYPTPGRAATGAAALSTFATKQRQRKSISRIRIVERRQLELPSGEATLSEQASKACLAAYGISVAQGTVLTPAAVAALEATPVPFPVVIKVESADLPHKTEAGAVRLNIASLQALKQAASEIIAAAKAYHPGAKIEGISIQPMLSGLEAIAGVVNDQYFGPTVVFGLGGIFTEILKDVTYRFAPFGMETAREMLMEIKGRKLLEGYRGQPPLDCEALAQTLARLSWLAADYAEQIAEIDINPIFVKPRGEGVMAADALIITKKRGDR